MRRLARRREIQVASVSHRPTAGVDTEAGTRRFLDQATGLIQRAARLGADLVAFPEAYPQRALPDPFHVAEAATGGTLDRVRGWRGSIGSISSGRGSSAMPSGD
ncbi:MAG: hypothetical protein KatS3mg108_1517 [Isosphaeraceae bacterium]|jgi:hypothetical protein|nr:MAG: hypothetical protein KatS3mg108_1517 [Isosphaeraceae bacterium]